MNGILKTKTALLLGGAIVALGFVGASAQTPAPTIRPNQAAQARAAAQVAPSAGGAPVRRPRNESFQPRARHLISVAVPGTLEKPGFSTGLGMVVLDADDNYSFVKRIPTWDTPGSMSPEQVAGMAASPVTNMIYVAQRGRIGAFDLATDKMVWETELDGRCCERPQLTPDGSKLVVGSDLQDYWFVLDPRTGKLLDTIQAPQSPNAHNLNLSADGKLAFMAPNGPVMSIGDVATAKTIKTIRFGDNVRPFVLNKDATRIYANTNNLLGFEIADVATGKIIAHVEVEHTNWKEKWNATPRPRIPHACPSHGIALVNDEKELWITDGIDNQIHIYDNTVFPPKYVESVKTQAGPYWITVGLDEKFAYISSGDVIDIKTHKIVGTLKDEFGRRLLSEKFLDMTFIDGHAQRVSNAFGNGYLDAPNIPFTPPPPPPRP
jgi:DNA-binding beta-propeller fold protein YncE